jgi:hypothetical protein
MVSVRQLVARGVMHEWVYFFSSQIVRMKTTMKMVTGSEDCILLSVIVCIEIFASGELNFASGR